MTVTEDGVLRMAPWSVPRLVVDQLATAGGDGAMGAVTQLPGHLLIDSIAAWRNNTPVPHTVRIVVTRRWKTWIVTNPNAVQFRDKWTHAIDGPVSPPDTSSNFNGQIGSAVDVSTNTVSEPNEGIFQAWWGTNSVDEWIAAPIEPESTINVWYRAYAWTPPPWSDNANRSKPYGWAEAGWARVSLWAYPNPGDRVTGG